MMGSRDREYGKRGALKGWISLKHEPKTIE
jgi:hypothetical protein